MLITYVYGIDLRNVYIYLYSSRKKNNNYLHIQGYDSRNKF